MWDTRKVSYIPFLSKIFLMIKWTKSFLFSCDELLFTLYILPFNIEPALKLHQN